MLFVLLGRAVGAEQGALSLKFDPEKAEKAQESWRRESEREDFISTKEAHFSHANPRAFYFNFCQLLFYVIKLIYYQEEKEDAKEMGRKRRWEGGGAGRRKKANV